ncbi:MAG: alpha/beta hydrolase, partial [SAR324 cluster bacterium]|nr:alpha/beta hydrolase [SAR324 cluster bacterium]
MMDHLKLERAQVAGFSMGGFASLIFGLRHPDRALSLVVAGCGYGSEGDRSKFERDVDLIS